MKSKFLFPTWCRILGFIMVIPGFVLGYLSTFKKYEIPGFGFRLRDHDRLFENAFENFTNELAIVLVLVGLLFIAFSKSKNEDELSAKMRLNALYWSLMVYYISYFAGLLYSLFVSEIPLVGDHINELNLFLPLLIFIIRYYYLKVIDRQNYLMSPPKFLPNMPFKPMGMLLSTISLPLFIVSIVTASDEKGEMIIEIVYLVLIVGLLLWGFSRRKIEDEMIMQQRLESLQLSVYFNYGILLVATLLFYSLNFLLVLMLAQFSLLLFYIIRMEYVNFKNKQLLLTIERRNVYEK